MSIVLKHHDSQTLTELRLWTERARQHHFYLQDEKYSGIVSDSAIILIYSLMNISHLIGNLSDEARNLIPPLEWEEFAKVDCLTNFRDPRMVKKISSYYVEYILKLDTYLDSSFLNKLN